MDLPISIELFRAPEKRLPALSFFVQSRRHVVSLAVEETIDEPDPTDYLSGLVHPLLLCTALAHSLVRPSAPDARVGQYVRGEDVSGLEESYLVLDGDLNDRELSDVLTLEGALLEDLMVLAMDGLFSGGGMSTEYARELVRDVTAETSLESPPLTVFEVRWATWLTANPGLTVIPLESETRAVHLFLYGMQHNSRFHNTTSYYEDEVSSVRTAVNTALSDRSGADVLEQLKAKYEVALRLRDRARQFYWWNPSEIDAQAVGHSAGEAYRRLSEAEAAPESEG